MTRTNVWLGSLTILALGVSLGFTGCAQETAPPVTQTPSVAFSSSTKTPSASATPSATASAEPSTPISANCSTLLSDGVIAKTYPGFVLKNDYTPAAGSSGADAVTKKGVACQWTDPNSGSTLTISAAHLGSDSLAKQASNLPGTSTSEFSSEPTSQGSFQVISGVGMAQLVTDKFWITADSKEFYSSADAVSIMSMLLAALEWDANNS